MEIRQAYRDSAASLRAPRTRIVGVILSNVTDPAFRTLLPSLEDELAKAGRAVVLCNANDRRDRQAEFVRKMTQYEADGMIICPAIGSTAAHFSSETSPLPPLVFVSRALLGTRFDCVMSDDHEAARLATERLLSLGHRRIAVIGGDPGVRCFGERLRGHREALDRLFVAFDDSLVRSSLPTMNEGFLAARWIAELSPRPTAAICYNGTVALGLFHGLMRKDLVPGREFALIGHEDIEEASLVDPPISATRVSHDEMGRRAAGALIERIDNPDAPPQRIVLKTELIVRGTCRVSVAAST